MATEGKQLGRVMATKKNAERAAPMIYVGCAEASVKAAQAAIASILSAPHADESTKRVALQALHGLCGVEGTVIQNCHLQG
jgi:hypothetical protein